MMGTQVRAGYRAQLAALFGGETRRPRVAPNAGTSCRTLLEEIGGFLDLHQLEPSAVNFEIARDFLSGHRETCSVVESLLLKHGRITDEMLRRMATARPGSVSPAAINEMAGQLAARLAETVRIVEESSASASEYGQALARESEAIGNDPLGAITRLVDLTQTVVATNRVMEARLETQRREAAQLRANLEKARHDAEHDHLTGLPNRRNIEARLESIAETSADGDAVCVALCDIDDFKRVNDDHGHEAGDRVLKYFAQLLRTSLKGGATVGRFGGEEFVCVFENCSLAEAHDRLDAAREGLLARALVNQETNAPIGHLSFSAGLAPLRGDAKVAMRHADSGLYRAKQSGKNRVVVAAD